MNCRQDEIVLVEKRCACLIARRIWGIKRKFGQEPFPARVCRGDLRQLEQVGLAKCRFRGCAQDAADTSDGPDQAPPANPQCFVATFQSLLQNRASVRPRLREAQRY